jgi:hypothetical protein
LPDRIERLEALGVVWEPHHAAWEQRFQELEAMTMRDKRRHVVPDYSENPQLATWLSATLQTHHALDSEGQVSEIQLRVPATMPRQRESVHVFRFVSRLRHSHDP